MKFDEIEFDMLGLGGTSDDESLEAVVNRELRRLACVIFDSNRDEKASITIKIKLSKTNDTSLVIESSVGVSEPKHQIKSLSAFISGGKAITEDHRQGSLGFGETVIPIKGGKNKN